MKIAKKASGMFPLQEQSYDHLKERKKEKRKKRKKEKKKILDRLKRSEKNKTSFQM